MMVAQRERVRVNLKDDQFHLNFSLHDAVIVRPRFEFNTLIFDVLEGGKIKKDQAWIDIKNASFLIQKVDTDFTQVMIQDEVLETPSQKGWRREIKAEEMDLYAFMEAVNAYSSSELTIIDLRVSYCSLGIGGIWIYEDQGESKMSGFTLSIICDEVWIWTDAIEENETNSK